MTNLRRGDGILARPALLAAAMLLAAPLVQAQQPGAANPQPSSKQQEYMQVRSKLRQLQQELVKIQEQVLDNNPELQQKQEDFRDLMMTTMKDQGATPEADVSRLKALQNELQKQDIPKDQRQKLIQEFRQANMALQKAQRQALQDEDVQKARESLQNEIITAMVDANPEAEKLLSQVKQAQQKLQEIRRQVQQQQQGGGAPAPQP